MFRDSATGAKNLATSATFTVTPEPVSSSSQTSAQASTTSAQSSTGTSSSSASQTSSTGGGGGGSHAGPIAGGVVGGLAVIGIIGLVGFFLLLRHRRRASPTYGSKYADAPEKDWTDGSGGRAGSFSAHGTEAPSTTMVPQTAVNSSFVPGRLYKRVIFFCSDWISVELTLYCSSYDDPSTWPPPPTPAPEQQLSPAQGPHQGRPSEDVDRTGPFV